jgi:putative transposase
MYAVCMSKHVHVHLEDEHRTELESLIRSGSSNARVQSRARILLLCDRSQGKIRTDDDVAQAALTSKATIVKTRKRFVADGLKAALYDRPRPGRAPKITGEIEAQLTVLACSDAPEGHNRWTLRLIADQMVALGHLESISHVAVFKRLKKTNSSLGKSNPGASGKPPLDS